MKITVKIRSPEKEGEDYAAWIEPQHLADRRELKARTGKEFFKVEAPDEDSLLKKITKVMYNMRILLASTSQEAIDLKDVLQQLEKG